MLQEYNVMVLEILQKTHELLVIVWLLAGKTQKTSVEIEVMSQIVAQENNAYGFVGSITSNQMESMREKSYGTISPKIL